MMEAVFVLLIKFGRNMVKSGLKVNLQQLMARLACLQVIANLLLYLGNNGNRTATEGLPASRAPCQAMEALMSGTAMIAGSPEWGCA